MNESILIVGATALFGAISKLWYDIQRLTTQHLQCEKDLAEMKGSLGILKVQMQYMESKLGISEQDKPLDDSEKVQLE